MLLRIVSQHATRNSWNRSLLKFRSKTSCDIHLIRPNSTSSNAKTTPSTSDFRRILALALPERYRLGSAIGLLVISSGITMSVPYAIGKIIDIIYNLDQLKESDQESQKQLIRERLKKVCLGLTGIFLIGGVCNFGRVYLMRVSGQNITAALREKLFGSIVKQVIKHYPTSKYYWVCSGHSILWQEQDRRADQQTVSRHTAGQSDSDPAGEWWTEVDHDDSDRGGHDVLHVTAGRHSNINQSEVRVCPSWPWWDCPLFLLCQSLQ